VLVTETFRRNHPALRQLGQTPPVGIAVPIWNFADYTA